MDLAGHTPPADMRTPVHRHRGMMSAVVGIFGFFCAWGVALRLGGEAAAALYHLPSLCVVIGGPVSLLLVIFGWSGFVNALAWLGRRPKSAAGHDAAQAVAFFQLAAAFAMTSGLMATLVGLVLMLTRLDDPRTLGPGVGLALISQLYGVFLGVACIAAGAFIARRHGGPDVGSAAARRSAGIAGIIAIAGTLTALVVIGLLMLGLSPIL